MPKPNPTGVRFADETVEQIADLARWWSPYKPLTLSDVVHVAVELAHKSEEKKQKKTQKTA